MTTTTNKLTPVQWAELEKTIHTGYPVYLQCDGHRVTLLKNIPDKGAVKFVVFVDGWMRGEWLVNKTEPFINFLHQKRQKVYGGWPAAYFKEMVKIYGKRKASKKFPEQIIFIYSPYYTSFAAFRRRITATCNSIEIINN